MQIPQKNIEVELVPATENDQSIVSAFLTLERDYLRGDPQRAGQTSQSILG